MDSNFTFKTVEQYCHLIWDGKTSTQGLGIFLRVQQNSRYNHTVFAIFESNV